MDSPNIEVGQELLRVSPVGLISLGTPMHRFEGDSLMAEECLGNSVEGRDHVRGECQRQVVQCGAELGGLDGVGALEPGGSGEAFVEPTPVEAYFDAATLQDAELTTYSAPQMIWKKSLVRERAAALIINRARLLVELRSQLPQRGDERRPARAGVKDLQDTSYSSR
ncbi:hypothetical protein FPV58_26075 [Mycolicibacterium porcinum]|uniref:hypothetical protein n=1 Tax=Mycolicibacterium porcinum TaxID=39693 RepID=UPI001191A7B5|nr:hypothetical protein [Mycolicibacterium porcinum]TVX96017.1 hypothetical protein FPV58_26075 [Mycolicibacterium porcinum]